MAMIVICYPFSGPIPFLNILIFISLVLSLFLHRALLVHFAKVETFFSNDIIKMCISVLKITLILKLFISILFFPRDEVFPDDKALITFLTIKPIFESKNLVEQFKRTIPLLVLLCLCVAGLIFEDAVFWLIEKLRCCKSPKVGFKKGKDDEDEVIGSLKYNEIIEEFGDRPKVYNVFDREDYQSVMNFTEEHIKELRDKALRERYQNYKPCGYKSTRLNAPRTQAK